MTESLIEQVQPIVDELTGEYGFESYRLTEDLTDKLGLEVLESDVMVDQARWSIRYRSVYGKDGEFVAISWSDGSH